MSDLITNVLQKANEKGKLNRTDVLLRYLRIKYRLKLTDFVLEKRIQNFLMSLK
jgi:hypothetical protein